MVLIDCQTTAVRRIVIPACLVVRWSVDLLALQKLHVIVVFLHRRLATERVVEEYYCS